jgi:hypothetical protein
VLSVPERTPRILLDSDEYPECVETTSRVFGPVKSKAFNGRETLKLTAFTEEALKAAEWYGAFGSGRSEDDMHRSVTWFQEYSRYTMQALNSRGNPTWKRRAVVPVGAVCRRFAFLQQQMTGFRFSNMMLTCLPQIAINWSSMT